MLVKRFTIGSSCSDVVLTALAKFGLSSTDSVFVLFSVSGAVPEVVGAGTVVGDARSGKGESVGPSSRDFVNARAVGEMAVACDSAVGVLSPSSKPTVGLGAV